jgi:hypothetical protein
MVWVADGGNDFRMWNVAANVLNKQSRAADKGRAFNLWVGRGTNSSSQEINVMKYYTNLMELSTT